MNNEVKIQDTTANPGPLGLVGFGFGTLLLNLHNAGLYELDTMILAVGFLLGGMLQLMVGAWEYRKNNMFGMVAFSSYGAFWMSLIVLMLLPKMGLGTAPSAVSMGYYLSVWGIFSVGMFFATLKANRATQILFACVAILFGLLALGDFTGNHTFKTVAGYEGIFTGALAIYIALAELYHNVYKKEILPLG